MHKKVQELEKWGQNLIDNFRKEYEKLNELERKHILDYTKYSAPCQIEIFWVSEPMEYQLFVQLYDSDSPDKEIKINEDNKILAKILTIAAFCNKASIKVHNGKETDGEKEKKKDVEVSGDPTEVALLILAEKSGIKQKEFYKKIEILDDIPFNTDLKFRATLI
ncbi:MAG: hypothetical protein KGD67_12090, partial [Candidatus Lokiarchaeota archaeon]|nr:hypothetical protein [Candidatus Lokiarchaeota archaeon]